MYTRKISGVNEGEALNHERERSERQKCVYINFILGVDVVIPSIWRGTINRCEGVFFFFSLALSTHS